MKKMLFYLLAFMPLSMMAQDDDLYFVPKKKASVEVVTDNYGLPKDTYYEGSNRSVDEYNRRMKSSYTEIAGDSSKVDVIDFNGQKGVYPDSLKNGDFELTKKMTRFDDYVLTDNEAFWAGYRKGVNDWGWHSPWYYTAIRITPIAATRYIMVAATQPIVRLAITLHAGHLAQVAPASDQATVVQQVVDPLEPAMVLADPAHRRAECQVAATVPSVPLVAAAPLAEADHVVAVPSVEAAEVVAQEAADSDAIDSLQFIVYGLRFTVYS